MRGNVAAMVVAGIDQPTIAQCARITEKTLRRHYRRELDTSYAIIKTQVSSGLIAQARAGNVKAQVFYLETHGWVRSERLVVADGGIDDSDVSTLTDEQLDQRIDKLRRTAAVVRATRRTPD